MSEFKGLVQQNAYPAAPDNTFWFPRINRRAEIVTPDWMTQLAIEGHVFELSNATKGTALAGGGTSYSDTAPWLNIDVPAGYTMVPLEILLNQGGTVAGALITVLLTADNKVRYSSGGSALTPKANRSDAPVGPQCVVYAGATCSAAGVARTFWASLLSPDVTPTADVAFPGYDNRVEWTARKFVPPVLVGPASLVIYTYAGTTQPSWFYTIKWLELPSNQIT